MKRTEHPSNRSACGCGLQKVSHISHVESGVVDKRASERLVVFQAAAAEQRFLPASSARCGHVGGRAVALA
jgi:hypothetical protein